MIHQRRQALRAGRPRAFFPWFVTVLLIWCLLLRFGPVPWNHTSKTPHTGGDRTSANQQQIQAERRKQFMQESAALAKAPGAGAIYGNTLESLVTAGIPSTARNGSLVLAENTTSFADQPTYFFNPYPYDTVEWKATHAEHVECLGPRGVVVDNVRVFRGRPRDFPDPGVGSFEVSGLDPDLCFERETRLGPYGLETALEEGGEVDWDAVNWGELQSHCRDRNKARWNSSFFQQVEPSRETTRKGKESRTAILLRTDTGREYTDNDRQVIRSLIMELNLRSGGEYQVFLLVHVKEDIKIRPASKSHRLIIEKHIPREFRDMSILWNTETIQQAYPTLAPDSALDHNSQLSPVQLFMQENREFDHVWTWDMDVRVIGHHYDILTQLSKFAAKQPRKGLWERNQRYYIPSFHGDYNTAFRQTVEESHIGTLVWGPPDNPPAVFQPIGPKPPVPTPEEDDYQWGVDEDADLLTLSPISKPDGSNLVQRYTDRPRRAQHLRLSRKLIDAMHDEAVKGNHNVAPETVALVHGLKPVYAPVPVFFDRAWDGAQLERWLNDDGRGGEGMGGTWDSGAVVARRLWNHWLGVEDGGVGGEEWEGREGRVCLPGVVLFPVGGHVDGGRG